MQSVHVANPQEHRWSVGGKEARIPSFPEPAENRQSWRSRAWRHSIASDFRRRVPAARYVGNTRHRTTQSHSIESIRSDRWNAQPRAPGRKRVWFPEEKKLRGESHLR